ncbi:hypothetical protein Q5P01_010033 [Channa striata]|uniref:Uncharacterized protein n=1 Tax=Channa striata TaxID=64152 RepID=A0AA88MX99_CHASR|nr:hypothetical protein Q5P01_010033 [Channa striata]
MYLYKATCPEIPNPKQKGSRGKNGGQGAVQAQGPGQGRLIRRTSVETGPRPYPPLMLWTAHKHNSVMEIKKLEEFLNFHSLSLEDTVKSQTSMGYSPTLTPPMVSSDCIKHSALPFLQ